MMDFDWIKDIDVIEPRSIIFLRRDKRKTKERSAELQSFMHQRGYKGHMGDRRIFRGECVGVKICEDRKKSFNMLLNYHGSFSPQTIVGYNIYYFEDLKNGIFTSNEKVRVRRTQWSLWDGEITCHYDIITERDELYGRSSDWVEIYE